YPPLDHHISESPEIHTKWEDHLANGYQPDKHKARHPIHDLNHANLVKDVGLDESAFFQTKSGKLVGLVIRKFCTSNTAVAYADAAAAIQLPDGRNVHKEDTGKLVQMGWSAGSRSSPHFDWAHNITKHLTEAVIKASNIEVSSLFALTWQMVRKILPPEVVVNFDRFASESGTPWMNGNCQLPEGTYQVVIDGKMIHFTDIELAPPGVVIGEKYLCPSHYEVQPHQFAIMWTTCRTPNELDGCHFFLSKYGIQIQQATNTLIVWLPEDAFGTSLPNFDPKSKLDPDFCQRVVAFVTSSRLRKAWKDLQSGLCSRKEAIKFTLEHDESDIKYQ
ncbi:hypothetical protein HYPSUDRAFT_140663, partial [Hypholoma sublateritium FD-334 SS-4]